MMSTYSTILSRPGAAWFSGTGLVARLPISMMGLGVVLLVENATGSYAQAGAVAGVGLLANAALAIPQGRLLDRFGQGRVLPLAISIWGVSLALLMMSVEWDWPGLITFALSACTGAALPSVGTCVRARWSHLLRSEPKQLATAFALEAVADETVYVVGPILVTMLATAVHPVAGLSTALVVGLFGTLTFARLRETEPPPHPRLTDQTSRPRMPWRTVIPLTVACAALGILFGAAEVTTVAFSEEQGHKAWSGPLLALWAVGSLSAGLVTGALTWRSSMLTRLRWGATAMTVAMAPLAFVGSLPLMGIVLLVGGAAIAPTLIATMSLAEQSLPASRLTEGMAFLQTGITAGVAPGAALAGAIVDHYGASPAYLVSVGGGVLALLAALATRATNVSTHD